MEYWILK